MNASLEAGTGRPRGGRHRRFGGHRVIPSVILILVAGMGVACAPLKPFTQPGSGASPAAVTPTGPVVGPPRGALMVAGGGALGPDIWEHFVTLAGGPEARIVIIPTAGTEEVFPEDWSGFAPLRAAGASEIRILHTRHRTEADDPDFAAVLQWATGVWIPGGRQWRLVDSYLNTRVHEELWALLARDGVIGGTSAGASIQADFLVRGDPETNQVMMAENYLEGFGFLTRTAVDQHLLARARESDLWEVLEQRPDLLGIGVDEGTALIVRGDAAHVVGVSQVLFYAWNGTVRSPLALSAGAALDLAEWRALTADIADWQLR